MDVYNPLNPILTWTTDSYLLYYTSVDLVCKWAIGHENTLLNDSFSHHAIAVDSVYVGCLKMAGSSIGSCTWPAVRVLGTAATWQSVAWCLKTLRRLQENSPNWCGVKPQTKATKTMELIAAGTKITKFVANKSLVEACQCSVRSQHRQEIHLAALFRWENPGSNI